MSKQNVLRLVRPDAIPQGRHDDGIFESISRRLFGCRHYKVSRPFTRDCETFVSCLHCGMRQRFDLERWKTEGDFYAQNDR